MPWGELSAAEQQQVLSAAETELRASSLEAVTIVAVESIPLVVVGLQKANTIAEKRLWLIGFASETQSEELEALRRRFKVVDDLREAVNVADAELPAGQLVRDACQRCWSRCCKSSPADHIPASDVPRMETLLKQSSASLATNSEQADQVKTRQHSLRLVEHHEIWVNKFSRCETSRAQFEGFAPAELRNSLGRFVVLADPVDWYSSGWQGEVLAARYLAKPNTWNQPSHPLRLVEAPDSLSAWLTEQEELLNHVSVLSQPSFPQLQPEVNARQEGVRLWIGERCCVQEVPNLFSSDECDRLVTLALTYQQPAKSAQLATTVPLPDEILQGSLMQWVEEKILAAARIAFQQAGSEVLPKFEVQDSPAAAFTWEAQGPGQYIRRNNFGQRRKLIAKMVAWLSPVEGGRLSFPWLACKPELNDWSLKGLPEAEASQKLLQAAGSSECPGVVPQTGSAVILWLQQHSDSLQESLCTWHVQDGWAEHGAWTLQKLWL
eukprot:TRINITY_DN23120_c0_g1_i1.p1 TRINITY_DN23120_c0_g1~~TRINITY_DN23120_c0_g1_i1.p1  ORF type:complete len:493 (+),score=96.06 TRINITY_DN23120_c0_g1_i1:160-1638(+)